MSKNAANLFQPVEHAGRGPAPIVIKVITTSAPGETVGGVMATSNGAEFYVRLSALPDELQQRVTLAVQAIQAAV